MSGCSQRLVTICLVVVLVFTVLEVVAGADLYGVLGISKTASDQEIKKAYRQLSMKYHPDKNRGDPEAEKKYSEVNHAYEVLSDPGQRQVYDQHGEEGLKQNQQNGGGGGFDPFQQFFNFQGGDDDDDEEGFNPFGQMFGGHPGFKVHFGGQKKGPRKAKKINIVIDATLEDVYIGRSYEINQRKPMPDGTTSDDKLTLVIERGMGHGEQIKFEGKGDPKGDRIPGDIIYHVNIHPHHMFRREGKDLHIEYSVPLLESLVGWRLEFKHLDGRTVVHEESGVTKPNDVKILKGEGMPVREFPSERGDLYIHCTVRFPDSLTSSQKDAVRRHLGGRT